MKSNQIILDLLRTYGTRGLFGTKHYRNRCPIRDIRNAIRVNLSRLVSRDLIEVVSRGQYRLKPESQAVNEFAESWRLGEERLKTWDGNQWIGIYLEKSSDRAKWVLSNHGFRALLGSFWARPANLSTETTTLFNRLISLGLTDKAICSEGHLHTGTPDTWIQQFDTTHLQELYEHMCEKLHSSLPRLSTLPRDAAKRESFALGGEAIELMAKDPLIPEQYMATAGREALWRILIEYDQAGRQIWATSSQTPDALITPNSKLISN